MDTLTLVRDTAEIFQQCTLDQSTSNVQDMLHMRALFHIFDLSW